MKRLTLVAILFGILALGMTTQAQAWRYYRPYVAYRPAVVYRPFIGPPIAPPIVRPYYARPYYRPFYPVPAAGFVQPYPYAAGYYGGPGVSISVGTGGYVW